MTCNYPFENRSLSGMGDYSMHSSIPVKVQYLTTALGIILFTSVVMVFAFCLGILGSNPARFLYMFMPSISLLFSLLQTFFHKMGAHQGIGHRAIYPFGSKKRDFLPK